MVGKGEPPSLDVLYPEKRVAPATQQTLESFQSTAVPSPKTTKRTSFWIV
jgi:hypothetical protein